jgi:hypothetical protein
MRANVSLRVAFRLGDKLGSIIDGRYPDHGVDHMAFKNGCVGIGQEPWQVRSRRPRHEIK